jgi:hypothetical protein
MAEERRRGQLQCARRFQTSRRFWGREEARTTRGEGVDSARESTVPKTQPSRGEQRRGDILGGGGQRRRRIPPARLSSTSPALRARRALHPE